MVVTIYIFICYPKTLPNIFYNVILSKWYSLLMGGSWLLCIFTGAICLGIIFLYNTIFIDNKSNNIDTDFLRELYLFFYICVIQYHFVMRCFIVSTFSFVCFFVFVVVMHLIYVYQVLLVLLVKQYQFNITLNPHCVLQK